MQRRSLAAFVAATAGLAALAAGGAVPASATGSRHAARPAVVPLVRMIPDTMLPKLSPSATPSLADCEAAGYRCYSPAQIRLAYGLTHLIDRHNDGHGQRIVVIDAYGSRNLRADLRAFDQAFKIAPAKLDIYAPLGAPRYVGYSRDALSRDQASWASETSLDVEWAHAMAPKATISLLETKNDLNGADFYKLEYYAYRHGLGHILSQSFGTAEPNYTGRDGQGQEQAYIDLYTHMVESGWTLLAAAGDSGSANTNDATQRYFHYPTVNFPASSPLVTSVGGTSLLTSSSGGYVGESAWDDATTSNGATGGGVSRMFPAPRYQQPLPPQIRRVLAGHRGVPDVSWDADPFTGVLIRCTSSPGCEDFPNFRGWALIGGTSAGAPQWAGLVADAASAVGHPLGGINTFLYRAGRQHRGFHDVSNGSNSYAGVAGYRALPGYDVATGWGSPTTRLEQALIRYGKSK